MKNKDANRQILGQSLFRRVSAQLISYTSLLLIFSLVIVLLVDLKPPKTSIKDTEIVTLNKIENIPEESLYIEWLGNKGFNANERTMILIHGEMPNNYDKKFSMVLNNTDYVYYTDNRNNYNIEIDVDVERELYQYWLEQDYNVGIFHFEKFADDSMEKLSQKLFNSISMRYKTDNGYVNSKIPNYSLTEILAATFLKEIPQEAYGNEIRLIGNGIGANLALSLSDYLYAYYEKGVVKQEVLPHRVSLIDPYLSNEAFNNNIKWRNLDAKQSMLQITENMLEYTTNQGLVVEIVENVEVTAEYENGVSVERLKSPYEYKLFDEEDELSESIKEKVAYLLLRQKYSWEYSSDYRLQNRAGLDWYLYSINGSDDSMIGSPEYSSPSYESSSCNWGRNSTRPMLNNRDISNNSSAGKNYAISAWTETVWIRALRGIEFRMKQRVGQQLQDNKTELVKDIHDQFIYSYKDYSLSRFRSENYQLAMNMNRTVIAGYIWNDKNEDRIMNDGLGSHLEGLEVRVTITDTLSSGESVTLVSETVFTSKDGFYLVRLHNSFKKTLTVDVTVIPPSSAYHIQVAATSTYHVADLTKHSFNKNKKAITVSKYYGNAVTIANCGLVVKK